ncbi:hypothetical protein MKW92_023924 [Papaver armeniacum]|nr:hypothetical protein MKW92_023924 [Papaver armeniacum]
MVLRVYLYSADRYDVKLAKAIPAEDKHLPMYDELLASKYSVEYIAGATTQNSIRVSQLSLPFMVLNILSFPWWMLQIPGATSYIECIGKDKFGEEIKKYSELAGVNISCLLDETAPTGTCAVCVVGGKRSVLNLASLQFFIV